MNATSLSQQDIVDGLHALGLKPGDSVMVHSSLKSFGRVDGGAQTVIGALMDVLTPEGTLLMPSFNHGAAFEEGAPGYYHPGETPTTNGAIPDCFWRLPGVLRSLDPTHPIAAWGKHSRRYVARHHCVPTMGLQSPLGLLYADDGYGLLLGVDYHANTFHHVVEMSTGAPCLGVRTVAYPVILPDGRRVEGRTWGWRAQSCPINDHATYQDEMAARGLQRVEKIGACRATLFRLRDCYEVVAGFLRSGKDGHPPCERCSIRPMQQPNNVPSDWDPVHQRLLPTSTAFCEE